MNNASEIQVRDVTVAYTLADAKRELVALQDFTLDVRGGEFITVVGPSGCGKTSLLNAIAGLVPVQSGTIHVDGELVTAPGPDRAVVFQNYALMPWRSVRENIRFGLEANPKLARKADARIDEVVELVGLRGFEDAYPHQLSGGMQQRVGLARALVVQPRIILMDEPFAAIDAMTREIMQNELERIVMETGTTAILITHSIDEAIQLGDRVIVSTTRPARIREDVRIDYPRPRGAHIKSDPEFIALRERIWGLLRADAVTPGAQH